MDFPSHTAASTLRKRTTYSRRATPAGDGSRRSITSNNDEAKGEEAYDRIRQNTRRGIHTGAERAAKLHNASRSGGAQAKPSTCAGALKKPSVSTLSTISKVKADMEEAIARSLADSAIPSSAIPLSAPKTKEEEESAIAKAKIMSLMADNELSEPSSNTRSYKNIGSGSTSSATVPHTPLHDLVETLEKLVKVLEKKDDEDKQVDPGKMANLLRKWGGTVLKVIYALDAAESRRIKDLEGQLDFDREIEEKHQKKIETSNKMWEVRMRQKEQEWTKKMEVQKEIYEAQIVEQKPTKTSPSTQQCKSESQEGQQTSEQPRTAQSPSPHPGEQIARLTNEIATLKAEHGATLHHTEASCTGAVAFLKQKAERLADQNAELRRTQKAKEEKDNEEKEMMKNAYEDQIRQLSDESEKLADANAKQRQAKQKTCGGSNAPSVVAGSESLTPSLSSKRKVEDVTDDKLTGLTTHSVPLPRSGTEASPLKRKLSHVAIPRSEGVSRSPKRARTRSMD